MQPHMVLSGTASSNSLHDNDLPMTFSNGIHEYADGYGRVLGTDNRILPVVMEGTQFGDNLRCATINSQGSGGQFKKVEAIIDFAVDKLLDILFVTELKVTLTKVASTTARHRGFFSWWGAREVEWSYNDGILVLVCDEWAKYVQKIEYWEGHMLWIDFAFPGQLRL
jgi:hypothetical protein